jgi:hypothetical protein
LAAVKSLFGFCQRMRHIAVNPAAELTLPSYEKRLAERTVCEDDVRRPLKRTQNRAIGSCYACFMPPDCEFRRLALAQRLRARGILPDYWVWQERRPERMPVAMTEVAAPHLSTAPASISVLRFSANIRARSCRNDNCSR